jgi:pimeloyl-ACP methyl ester carboxylesterase
VKIQAWRLLAIVAALATLGVQDPSKGPSAKELDACIERYFACDGRTAAGRAEQIKLLATLDRAPELTTEQVKTWRDKLAKSRAKSGRELEKKDGAHWFWPADKKKGTEDRGLYIVGGETKKPKGLLLGMHGGGAGAGDAWSSHGDMNSAAAKLDWLAIFPEVLEKTEHGWTDSGTEEFVLDLIDDALRTWKIDRDHVYLAGHSMGGYGSWTLGARHADLIAAIAPSAGAPTPIFDSSQQVIDIDSGVIPSLRNVPIRIYQSDNDLNVPPATNRVAAKRLEEARARWGGFDFEYWEVPGRAHDLPPGGMITQLEKIAAKTRAARPDKVVWQPVLSWVRQFYWLWWETPARGAIVEAQLDKTKNAIDLRCDSGSPAGLSILLDDALLDLEHDVTITLDGKQVFKGQPKRTLATLVMTAERDDAELSFSARVPINP